MVRLYGGVVVVGGGDYLIWQIRIWRGYPRLWRRVGYDNEKIVRPKSAQIAVHNLHITSFFLYKLDILHTKQAIRKIVII
jgi:hypothetical protein